MAYPQATVDKINALINPRTSGPIGRSELVEVLLDIAGLTPSNPGTVPAGVTVVESGNDYDKVAVLTIDTTLGAIAGGAALALGKLVYTFPAGRLLVNNVTMSMAIQQTTGNITADTPEVAVGTTLAAGASATLATTTENLILGSAAADCDGTPTIAGGVPTANVPFLIAAADAHTVHFNVADTWAASGDPAAEITGTIIISYSMRQFA